MASQSGTRPATNANFQQFTSGNTAANTTNCQQWIIQNGLKRNQIISITANETEIQQGDQVMTVFYRERSVVDNDLPLDDIQFNCFNHKQTWEQQLAEANSFKVNGVSPQILSISRTPKNIGNTRNQTAWYTSQAAGAVPFCTTLNRGDGDWDALAKMVQEWLNSYIAPHQLISVSFHEESHPNNSRCVAALICHTAGANPVRLQDSPAREAVPMAGIYTMNTFVDDDTRVVANQALSCINMRGGQEGHMVTTANDSTKDQVFAAVFSWSPILELQLLDNLRPTGCAGCTIF